MTPLRIGNCSGYFGDRRSAARELIEGGELDVLTGDYLAEATMLILARQRMRDPTRGYVSTFVPQMEEVLGTCLDRGIKIVANAGGLNPASCAKAVGEVATEAGLRPRIATVYGDDLLPDLGSIQEQGWAFPHATTGAPISSVDAPIVAANAYLGSWGIVKALHAGADVVITGRVTDSALALAPAAWHFEWAFDDWDRLSAGIIAGHLIECSTQVTGGNYSFFDEIADLRRMGMPIIEMRESGEFIVTKHPETGGAVRTETVIAQLLYEIGSPGYLTPDVTAHFDSVTITPDGPDRILVRGARGSPPPDTLKTIAHYPDGFRNRIDVIIGGGDIENKADAFERLFWEGAGGKDAYLEARSDRFVDPRGRCFLRFAARSSDRERVGRSFSNAAVELVLASVPGVTLGAPPKEASMCGGIWPTTVPRELVTTTVELDGVSKQYACPPLPPESADTRQWIPLERPESVSLQTTRRVPLGTLCGARSGDKGGDANVGFWVRDISHYPWLCATLTKHWVREHLPEPFDGEIECYALPNIGALNFLLKGYLGAGVTASVQLDAQAKFLGEQLRDVVVDAP